MISQVNILGVNISAITSKQVVDLLLERVDKRQKTTIVTVNTEFIIEALRNPEFKNQLNAAEIATADGIGILWAARVVNYETKTKIKVVRSLELVLVAILLGVSTLLFKSQRYRGVPEQITGVDLSIKLARLSVEHKLKLFLLGERPGVAEEAAQKIMADIPGVKIAGTYSGIGDQAGDQETREVLNAHPAEILLVAYGAPKQEMWIKRNLLHIPSLIAMGVGGTFMFLSGRTKRAPAIIRRFGLEWLYRLITQPWRWKRQLALPRFVLIIIQDKINSSARKV